MKAKWERDRERRALVLAYEEERKALKGLVKSGLVSEAIREAAYKELQDLPRDSAAVRTRNRCILSGRSRGVSRWFRASRIVVRAEGRQGSLPGVSKGSW